MPPPPPHECDVLPKPLRVVVVLLVLVLGGGLGCAAMAAFTACGRGVEIFVML